MVSSFPSSHPNCRCSVSPNWETEAEQAFTKTERATRAKEQTAQLAHELFLALLKTMLVCWALALVVYLVGRFWS